MIFMPVPDASVHDRRWITQASTVLCMHRFFLSSLLFLPLLLGQGTVHAASGIGQMNIPGVTRQDLKATPVAGLPPLAMQVIHARNLIAGLPDPTSDPLPCRRDLYFGELASGQPGYQSVRRHLLAQGWQSVREVRGQSIPDVAFQFRKRNDTLLGLWRDAPGKGRATLVMCEQAAQWKPTPPLKTRPLKILSTSPVLGKTVKFKVPDWHLGAQVVFPVLAFTGDNGSAARIDTGGEVQITLTVPTADQLQPIGRWRAAFDLFACTEGDLKGALSISDPHVRFTAVKKFRVGKVSDENDPYLFTQSVSDRGARVVETPLIYTSGPVRISGHLKCPDGDRNLDVDVNLPGGWTVINFETDLPRVGKMGHKTVNWGQSWHWIVAQP